MENEDWVYKGRYSLIEAPRGFSLNSVVAVEELFEDLIDIGARDHAQFPTLIIYRDGTLPE